jgi:hypothetical protein
VKRNHPLFSLEIESHLVEARPGQFEISTYRPIPLHPRPVARNHTDSGGNTMVRMKISIRAVVDAGIRGWPDVMSFLDIGGEKG